MLKLLLTSSLLLSAVTATAVASSNEANEYRETERYESNERNTYNGNYRDSDDRERGNDDYRNSRSYAKMPLRSAKNDLYAKECGSCHFAYQAELLPRRSWIKMMGELDNHFGTDATLAEEERLAIEKHLVKNAGDTRHVTYKHYQKINRSIAPDDAPQRISKTRYFLKEHRKLSPRLIEQREVKSLSNCIACHTTADKGYYGERDILIPNYGRWED